MGLSNVAVSRLALTWEVSTSRDPAVTFALSTKAQAHQWALFNRSIAHTYVTVEKVGHFEGGDLSPFASESEF